MGPSASDEENAGPRLVRAGRGTSIMWYMPWNRQVSTEAPIAGTLKRIEGKSRLLHRVKPDKLS